MYSDKENINILTALLVAHGVQRAVVCPGSRNAPITHNLCACPDIQCVSVTDERSATFVALGMALSEESPVAVCVTSGSALLNTLPAVAEACYQHVPLVVISADRPTAMIGQLQGQTLPQAHALAPFVKAEMSLPEPHDERGRWYCNRLCNEALIAMQKDGGGPVHINVPVSEPLFGFQTAELPRQRVVKLTPPAANRHDLSQIASDFCHAARPMIVIGQLPYSLVSYEKAAEISRLRDSFVMLQEKLSDEGEGQCHFDEALTLTADNSDYLPDFVIYLGDTLVSKRVKRFLQGFIPRRTVVVNEEGRLTDVTMHATDVVTASAGEMIEALAGECGGSPDEPRRDFYQLWHHLLDKCSDYAESFEPAYSQMMAVKRFHQIVNNQECWLHYANSTAIRLGQLFSTHYLFANRGVNGIEGSLSTAVGFASRVEEPVYCVIGDLSFFYDQNALWNSLPKGNLRILLLNNGGGGIFRQLPGLEDDPYRDDYISAAHQATAKGVCETAGIEYLDAWNADELQEGIVWLTTSEEPHACLLEVFTDSGKDAAETERYMNELNNWN